MDYASPETRAKGMAAIKRELEALPDDNPQKATLLERLQQVHGGKRDLFF